MEENMAKKESLSTQPHSANLPEHSNASCYNNIDNSFIPSSIEESDNSDPFLLVSVSNSQLPQRKKQLILIAIVDLIIIFALILFSMHKSSNSISWDLFSYGIFRITVVLGVASSVWIRDLGWIIGGACGVSSLCIIFKTYFLIQSKHSFEVFLSIFLLTSFFFSQIYWIVFILITIDKKTNYNNIFFEEEYNQTSPLNTLRRGLTSNSDTRSYGAIVQDSDDIDILINDGEITSSTIDNLVNKEGYNTIKIIKKSISSSLPIPIASSASSGGSAKSLKNYKKKMKLQNNELPLHKRESKNITEEVQNDKQLNEQENSTNNDDTFGAFPIKVDTDNDLLLLNDDSLLLNDNYGDEGLIVTSIGYDGSIRDRQGVYFQPPKEDCIDFRISALDNESDDENNQTIAAGVNNICSDSNDESLPEDFHKKSTTYIEINSNDKKTSTSFERTHNHRKYPSASLGDFRDEEDGEFNFKSKFARNDDDFVGSAPVGNGRWSTLKRKKIELDDNNLNYFDDSKDEFIKNNYGHVISSNSSLLTAAFNSELHLQNSSKTELSENFDEQEKESPEINNKEISSVSKDGQVLSITLPSSNNHSNFIPKSSSPLASRVPILPENNEEKITHDTKSSSLFDKEISLHNNQSITLESNNDLLTPIVEEPNPLTMKENPYSLTTNKNSYRNINIDLNHNNSSSSNNDNNINFNKRRSNHSRETSNSLQMLFADIQDCNEKNTSNSTNENNNNNNLGMDSDDVNRTIFINIFNTAVKSSWNNEFNEAEEILNRFKNGIPRWNVTYAETQLIKHLMTGQTSDNEDPKLMNALVEAEKLAIKVCDNKDDFETSFSLFRTDIWKVYVKPNSSPSEDEAGFASLRTNYRWDCELAMADVLLFHAILQVIGGSEIKGALNLRKAWKTYSKVRDEIDRIKGDAGKNENHKYEPSSSSNRWSLGGSILRRGSIGNMVGFGGIRSHNQDASSTTLDGINNNIEIYSDIEDYLEFGFGVFYFILSIVPGSFQSILKTFGFNAEREKGIQLLERCYSRNGIRAPFAALFLLVNYLFLPHGVVDPTSLLNKAGIIIQECVRKYPKGSPFLFIACQQARKSGQIKEALNHITNGISNCEMIGVTSTNYRFEKGMTYLINLDFAAAKDIFELLFYGNTIVFTGKNGSIRLHGSLHGSSRLFSRDGSTNTKKDNSLLQFFEFELRPFCGLCLAGCYLILKSGQIAEKEALGVLKQTKAMTDQSNENNGGLANSIGLLGTSASGLVGFGVGGNNSSDKKEPKANRYNKFAGRRSAKVVEKNSITPFLIFIILYLRRDIFYMTLELKKRWANLLESIWGNNFKDKSVNPDTIAVYLLIRGVFEKFLNTDDPTIAQKTLCECLAMESGVISETWVIPHCRYELGELFYKQFGNQEAAMEQFNWILKGARPISRGRRDSTLSLASIASKASNDSNSSSYGQLNPDRFKKYEFSKVLKNRCTVATDQIRANVVQPTNTFNNNSNPIPLYHSRKKSGSISSLLKEVQEQSLLQKHHQRQQSSTEIKVGTPTDTENKKSGKSDTTFTYKLIKKGKSNLPINEERRNDGDESTNSINSGSSVGKGVQKGKKIFGFKFK